MLAEWYRQESEAELFPEHVDRVRVYKETVTHPLPLLAPSRGSGGWVRGAGMWREDGVGGSYQEAVVLGVGGQAQAKAHVVLPLRHVG